MKPGTTINRYVLDKLISNIGGTAQVYLAHLINNEKLKVVIKIARTDSESKAHEDFLLEKEAELLQRWDWRHPGIVRVYPSPYNAGKPQYAMRATELADAPYYLVMEYLRGETLSQKLKTIQPFPLEWKLELFYQVLITVSFIHGKGYAHRDLKPDNIVFREPISVNHLPQPVLIDFALTTTNDDENFDVVENSMTIDYSPPERIAKSMGMSMNSDFLAQDVWSLGMIFHEILTGKFMIQGNQEKIRTTIIRERLEPRLPDSADYHILAAFIREMLNPEMDKRPTVDLLMKAIENKFLPPRILTV